MIPDIAIGAIAAALITGAISFIGLIVSKESKVSEFRQSWIDSLRSELATYLANINTIVERQQLPFDSPIDRFNTLQPLLSKLNEAYYMIVLRLNTKEQQGSDLKSAMIALSQMVHLDMVDFDKLDSAQVRFLETSNLLIKEEWKRVKRGERAFQVTCILAGSSAFLILGIAVYLSIQAWPMSKGFGPTIAREHGGMVPPLNEVSPDGRMKAKVSSEQEKAKN